MNSVTLHNLIDSIGSLLEGRPFIGSVEMVAHEYAEQCRMVNERLARIPPMLEEGGEIQALQLAEQAPRVLDLSIALNFDGSAEWREFCREHGHEVAPLIDSRTLNALLAIRNKGVSPNHPLYKDYRAAVSSRNDAKAYELIWIITRLNPDDENAASELKRLERKALQAALADLRTTLASGHHEEVSAIMQRVEQVSVPEAYENTAEWQAAVAIRQQQRREDAWRRMPVLLRSAETEMTAGNWRDVAVLYGEFSQLFEDHGIGEQTPDMLQRAVAINRQLEEHRRESARVARVKQLLTEMSAIAEEVENRALTPRGLSLEYAGPQLEKLGGKWWQLEDLKGEIPAAARTRIETARAQLAHAIESGRAARRKRIVTTTVAVSILSLLVIGTGLCVYRAEGLARKLVVLQAAKQSSAAVHELLDRVNDKDAYLMKYSPLATAAADARHWLDTVNADAKLADQELRRLERAREDNFASMASPELFERMNDVDSMISKLPVDLANTFKARQSILKSDGQRTLEQRQDMADVQAGEVLAHWTDVLGKLDNKAAVSATKEAIKDSVAAFAPYLELEKHKEPLLRLPDSTASKIRDIVGQLNKVTEQVEAVEKAVISLERADTMESYRTTLETLAGCAFKEAGLAKLVLDVWPNDNNRVKSFLTCQNDISSLKVPDNNLDVLLPEEAVKDDRDVITGLTENQGDDKNESKTLNGIWELEWQKSNGPPQPCLSDGALKRIDPTTWEGNVAIFPISAAHFLKFNFFKFNKANGFIVTLNRISPVSSMMQKLQVSQLLDETGTKFRSSILPMIDRVMTSKDVNPLARAYVLSKLYPMIRGREVKWGVNFCPEAIADLEEFKKVETNWPVINNSWWPVKKTDGYNAWQEFFRGKENRCCFDTAKKMMAVIRLVKNKPIILVGMVDKDGAVKLQSSPRERLLIGIEDVKAGDPGFCLAGVAEANSAAVATAVPLVPLSPVLSIEMQEKDQVFLQSIHSPAPGLEPANIHP